MQKETGELERAGQQERREKVVSSKVPRGLAWEPCARKVWLLLILLLILLALVEVTAVETGE
jgi:hypothetical protein